MVLAYHVTFGAYGFWLPNDPRGSWSQQVRARHLRRFGPATKVTTTRSLANAPHDPAQRLRAKRSLKYSAVHFTNAQIVVIGEGFDQIIDKLRLQIFACAIMPDHVHLVTARHSEPIESVVGFLKRTASRELARQDLHPLERYRRNNGRVPTPWSEGGWYVYPNSPDEVSQRIRYVEANPLKAGLPAQHWPFVGPLLV